MKLAARGESLDNARYALGKQIYTGRLPLPERANARLAASQRPRLEAAAPKLASLAGRLTEDQLSALEYYVSRRN